MNWLIYVAGWWWGWSIINTLDIGGKDKDKDFYFYANLILWTATWVWVCWRFIK